MKPYLTRRELLNTAGRGFGGLALASMLEANTKRQSAGAEAAAFSGARQGGDPSVHARRREPRRHVRSQAAAQRTQWPDHFGGGGEGAENQPYRFHQSAHARQPLEVFQAWPERHGDFRAVPRHRIQGGRDRPGALLLWRCVRSRAWNVFAAFRVAVSRAAEPRLLGGVRPWLGEPEPAGVTW